MSLNIRAVKLNTFGKTVTFVNKTGNVRVTIRRVHVAIVVVEKQ